MHFSVGRIFGRPTTVCVWGDRGELCVLVEKSSWTPNCNIRLSARNAWLHFCRTMHNSLVPVPLTSPTFYQSTSRGAPSCCRKLHIETLAAFLSLPLPFCLYYTGERELWPSFSTASVQHIRWYAHTKWLFKGVFDEKLIYRQFLVVEALAPKV